MGVLCELAVQDGVIPPATCCSDIYEYAGTVGYPPLSVQAWSGLESDNGPYHVGSTPHSLTGDNDSKQQTFDEIASIIDQRF